MKANYNHPQSAYKQAAAAAAQARQGLTRRLMMGTALALSDVCGYGTVRVTRVLEALAEILEGYSVYDTDYTADMAAELRERGIILLGITDAKGVEE